MSELAVVPETNLEQRVSGVPRRLMAAVALVSFASLLLELSLTRLFSVVLFYHFAFLAISVALLGLGAGGVFAYIQREWLEGFSTARIGAVLALANGFVIVAALEVVLRVPVSLELTRKNFYRLTEIYVASAVPFFFVGLLFAVVFARESRRVGMLYGADLLGGALACMAVVPVLDFVGGPNAVLLAAAAMAAAGALWAGVEAEIPAAASIAPLRTPGRDDAIKKACVALAAVLVVAIAANYSGKLVDIIYAKGMRRDRPWMLFAKWNAISRVEVNQVGESKYIVIDADASTAIMNVDPKRWAEDTRPTPHDNGLPQNPTYNWKRDLMAAAPAVANVLRPRGEYAIIGPGGGVDVLRAVANGSPNVTGIEINSIIVNDIMKGRYADYAYHLYEQPNVHIHVSDGRSWIRASNDKYDVVQMTLVDTWASTAAGAFALSENNLYTLQAFREYFDHLKPDGMIAITRWEFAKPREALRVVSQELSALAARANPDAVFLPNFIIVSDGALDADGRPVTVLAKKSPFTDEEIGAVLTHVAANQNLHVVYAAGRADAAIQSAGARLAAAEARRPFAELIASGSGAALAGGSLSRTPFVAAYPYDITPVDDNAPFFFFTLKTRDVIRETLAGTGKGMDWRINLGIVVLGLLLLMSMVAVALFLIVPLAVHEWRRRRGSDKNGDSTDEVGVARLRPAGSARDDNGGGSASVRTSRVMPLLYFVAIGLGYILVEVAFIQRFCLFLGHPTYALTVVVFLMLLSSGAGSMASRRLMKDANAVRWALAAIVAAVLVYCAVLPWMLATLVGLPFFVKLLLSGVVLVPLGFCMGMPFPTGLRVLGRGEESLIEWAWAMNASASVLGSVAAMVIAIHFGLNVTLATGAAAYVAAGAFTWALMRVGRTA